MDSLKKLDEFSKKNNEIFDGILNEAIFGRKDSILKRVKGSRAYVINGNYVYKMGTNHVLYPYSEDTWHKPELRWLVNAKFRADYLSLGGPEGTDVNFYGIWEDGVFKGDTFGENSYFKGGEFRGQKYESSNKNYTAPPTTYYNGKWTHPENGVLGVELLKETQPSTSSVEILSVPIGWFINLVGIKGEKLSFSVLKKIDNESTDFVFQVYPNLEKITVKWEDIRSNYLKFGIIARQSGFGLLGKKYKINLINSISLSNEPPLQRISAPNIIDFSSDPELKGFLTYNGTSIPMQINSRSQEGKNFVEQFKKDLARGVFFDILMKIKGYMSKGLITGYDEFIDLASVFNNIKGSRIENQDIKKVLKYLDEFMKYVVRDAQDFDTDNLIAEVVLKMGNQIVAALKKTLEVDKYIKKPEGEEVEKDEEGDDYKEKMKKFTLGKTITGKK